MTTESFLTVLQISAVKSCRSLLIGVLWGNIIPGSYHSGAADRHDITMLCLPSQATYELQHMDKSIFGPFEYYWDNEVLLFCNHSTDRTPTKQRFGKIFIEAWDKAVTPANIKAGFHATGICLFNPSIIFDKILSPVL
jgi:hypothetical protein